MKLKDQFATNTALPRQYGTEFLVLERGEGVYLYDIAGNRYLDFTAGIAVNALGYGDPEISRIMAEQAEKLIHVSNLFSAMPTLTLAERLCASGGFAAAHLCNSGTEANEAALKYARLYARAAKGEHAVRFLCFTHGFHGRTMGSLSVTPTPAYQEKFLPLVPGVVSAPYNDVEALEALLDERYAAVIVEPVQGEGGLEVMSREFAEVLNRLCRKYDVLLIADEVQTGLGRTGYLYGSEAVGLEPDIITLAKPLGGGLPLGATLIPERVNNLLSVGDHGSTFGGGPLACAVGLHVWETVSRPEFLAEVREKGEFLARKLEAMVETFPFVLRRKGLGLLQGLELSEKVPVKEVIARAREKGLLVLRSGRNVVRLAPPLVVSREELEEGCAILEAIFAEDVS
ncbi:aspartate aminotransferase family protein [Spirochaeta thermophila]|uniref:Acetylornithine aminotransferase n=1 Tax=Winmispira thermophila (strain ATCC 49972 / DSM 6192 / RI 19.B1) TaxID=665571 RepID=E0RQG4_WINT6|nr:aspartate aminotransferase family protein [Spirochaeta thermophila]ADN02940.1 acetylornithine aminotransferase [Spirochaeta thermophila DSM 6192]